MWYGYLPIRGHNLNTPLEDMNGAPRPSLILSQCPPLPEDVVTSGEYCEIDASPGPAEEGEMSEPFSRRSPHRVGGYCYSIVAIVNRAVMCDSRMPTL